MSAAAVMEGERQSQPPPKTYQFSITAIQALLASPIAFHRVFVEIGGGVTAGLLLSQIWYWTRSGGKRDGWFWKTQEEWEVETGLTRREQETARQALKARGLIEEKLKGVPARLHFRLNTDRLITALNNLPMPETKRQSRLAENAKLECTEAPNKSAQKRQTITEITS